MPDLPPARGRMTEKRMPAAERQREPWSIDGRPLRWSPVYRTLAKVSHPIDVRTRRASSMSTLTEDKLERHTDYWLEVGRRSALAYAMHTDWLFRRVETIDFVGSGSVKRHISVDFEMPPGLPELGKHAAKGIKLVPITVYYKWPPLMGFDFLGPDGRPTSLHRRATNRQLDFGLLLGMVDLTVARGMFDHEPRSRKDLRNLAREIAKTEVLDPCLQCRLKTLVDNRRSQWTEVGQATNELREQLTSKLARTLNSGREDVAAQIAATVDLAGRLADSSILWVGVDGKRGTDRIVKFSYNDHYSSTEAWYRRWWTACSWRQSNVFISLPHAGRNVIYHLDIQAPNGSIEIAGVDVTALPAADGEHDGAEAISVPDLADKYPEIEKPDRWVGPDSTRYYLDYGKPKTLARTSENRNRGRAKPRTSGPEASSREASVELGDGRAHVYLGSESTPSHRVFLQVKLAMRRSGFVTSCMWAAIGIAALMTVAYYRLESAADHLDATAVLLSIVPLVLGYVLVRPGEDTLEHHHLSGVRFLALVSGALPLIGTLTLVFTHTSAPGMPPDLAVAKPIWLGLMLISWLLFILLSLSYVRARNSEGSRSRRQPETPA